MNTRRELIRIGAAIATASTTAPAQDQHHADPPNDLPAPRKARFCKPAELDLLAKLVDRILPPTDTPGAAAANVHYYIDWMAFTNKALGSQLRKDLAWIRKQGFLQKDQVALLTAWSQSTGEPRRIFQALKDLTIDGYYGTREGLQIELGWNANTFVREFKGCSHPEHA